MEQINEYDKKRLIDFIEQNELDYYTVDNLISKFSLVAADGVTFYIYKNNDKYILVKYDKEREHQKLQAYFYFRFNNIPQILEQLKIYDESIPKLYWLPTTNSIEVAFDSQSYNPEWFNEFKGDRNWQVVEEYNYQYLVYENENYKPELISPFKTLHEVSLINKKEFNKVSKLYFEIHPVSCQNKNESYFFKLLYNDIEPFKEYINWNIYKKKGLRLFLEDMFKNMEKFKLS
jgi:hypothetical protein